MNGPTWMREPVLQGAAAALDPASARRAIESALFDGVPGSEIGPCEVERVRYAPREKLQVTYRFEVVRHDTGTRTVQRASARLYPVGESSRRYRRARVNARSHAGRALGHVPEMGMVLWGFPNDRKLESIARLLDSTWLETKALPALPTVTSAGRCQPELVRYVSEHTCTVRVAVPTKEDARPAVLYAKTYYDAEGARTFEMMRQLWTSTARSAGLLAMAKPLGYQARANVLWQTEVPGRPLGECDLWNDGCTDLLRSGARTLGALHRTTVTGAPAAAAGAYLRELDLTVGLLACIDAEVAAHAAYVVGRLRRSVPATGPVATLHGDVHLKNFVAHGDTVALIDLDGLRRGSPWRDLGSLEASLHQRAAAAGTSPDAATHLSEVFIEEYARHVPWPVDEHALRWHRAAALIAERARRAITRLRGGPEKASRFIGLAERILAGHEGTAAA